MIIRIDASSLKDAHCLRKLFWRIVGGYRTKGADIEMHYGTCFHHFAEQVARGVDPTVAEVSAREMFMATICNQKYGKDYLNAVHLSLTCRLYTMMLQEASNQWNAADILASPIDNSPLVECKFSLPIYADAGVEILLQGTMDRISKIKGRGCMVIEDFKTTSSKDPDLYFKGFKMSPQMLTYTFALHQLAAANPYGLFGRLMKENPTVGCRIKGVFLDPKLSTRFVASEIAFFAEAELEKYYNWLMALCQQIVFAVKTNTIPDPVGIYTDTCRSAFGSYCPFFDICKNETTLKPEGMQHMLKAHFQQKDYKPLEFGGGHSQKAIGQSVIP